MKKIIFSIFAIAAILTSCNKNEPQVEIKPEVGGATIYASIEDNATKTTYDEGSILWATGDAILVLNTVGGIDAYALTGGSGTKDGVFTNVTSTEKDGGMALYPASDKHSYDPTTYTVTVNLPQSYGSTETEYTPNTNVPMVGIADESTGGKYAFKHLGAAIRVTVAAPVGTQEVSLTAAGIAGNFNVTLNALEITQAADATETTVSHLFKPLTEATDLVFYFPVPTGKYQNLKIDVKGASATFFSKNLTFSAAKELGRKQIAMLPKLTSEIEYDFDEDYEIFGIYSELGATKELSNAEHVSGTHSLKLSNPAAGDNYKSQLSLTLPYNLDMNKTYYVSFNVKSSVAGQIQFQYQCGDYKHQDGYAGFDTTTEWQEFKTMFSPKFDDITRLIVNFGSVVADYYIDDYCFGELETGDNLITNGGFEFGLGGWNDMSWNPKVSYAMDEAGHTGNCVLCTLQLDEDDPIDNMSDAQLSWPIKLTKGKEYSYSFWAKSDSGLNVQVIAQNPSYAGLYNTPWHTATSEWVKYSGVLSYPEDGPEGISCVILQFAEAGKEGAKLWVDDVVLTEN